MGSASCQGVGVGECLSDGIATGKQPLGLRFGQLVLVVLGLVVEALGDAAVCRLDFLFLLLFLLLNLALHRRKESGLAASHDLGAFLGARVDVGVGPVLLAVVKVARATWYVRHFRV